MFARRTQWSLTPNRLTEAVLEAQRGGRKIVDLTLSNPARAGIAYDQQAILDALHDPRALDYDPQPKGMLCAREAVAQYYEGRGESVPPERLVLTASTSEGYSFVFRLLADPGDEVLVPKPSYPLFDFLAGLQDVRLVPYPLLYDHGWQIDLHSLGDAITARTRAIVLVHPNNPTGSYVNDGERSRLNELCARHGLALIVDEVFLDYPHDQRSRQTFAANSEALTFTLSGLSKISALPQMKLAWIAVGGSGEQEREALARLEIIADTFLSLGAPVQLAASVLLRQRTTIQPQLLWRISRNLRELDRQLAQQPCCSRLVMEGGWYAVLRVPVTQPDEDLAIKLLRQHGVLVHPGHFYDFPADGHLVVSLIAEERVFSQGISSLIACLGT
ncbi:MAG TPA: pyridoxal phosphate-dependent aminotransferase [Terriglobales bacterium]|nr:pyridoxal phosphate-dependent aminotransferase [Terriglobales bacterium]